MAETRRDHLREVPARAPRLQPAARSTCPRRRSTSCCRPPRCGAQAGPPAGGQRDRPGASLHRALGAQLRRRQRQLPAGLVHDEVQPQDQRGRRPGSTASPACIPTSRRSSCRARSSSCTSSSGWLAEIAGLARTTLQPAAGAHGELTGLLIMRAYHHAQGREPKKIIIPDTAHGTNPASVVMAGYAAGRREERRARRRRPRRRSAPSSTTTSPASCSPTPTRSACSTSTSSRSRGSSTRPAACSTTTAPTPTPSWACRGPATWASTSCTSTRTRRSRTPHGGGGPGAGPIVVRDDLEPFLPVPLVEPRRGRPLLPRPRPSPVHRQGAHLLRQLRRAGARLHLHPRARRRTACAASARRRCSTPTTCSRASATCSPCPSTGAACTSSWSRRRRSRSTACARWTSPSGCSTTACTRRPPTSR